MSKKLLALLLIAMMLFTTACGGPADEPADDGDNLIIATSYVSSTLDPHYTNGATSNYYWMQYVYEVPLAWGADGKVYPLICDYTENDDCTEFTLTVRDYTFSNGEKITAEDVLASLERVAATGGSFQQNFWQYITEKTIEGDTINLKSDVQLVNFIWELGDDRGPAFIMPKEICEKYADGAQIDKIEDVIGSGPYVLDTYEPDTTVAVKKNENYIPTDNGDVGGHAQARLAHMDTITWKVNTDTASQTAGMMNGDYHIGSVLAEMQEQALESGLKRDLLENQWTHAIFFNLDESNADSPVQDVNFRKAFRAALDMNAIMLSVMQGDEERYVLNASPIAPANTTYYNNIIDTTEWNIADKELAKEYLAKTDYDGEPIVWLVSSGGAFYRAAMAAIPMLEEVGINVELQVVDGGSHGALRVDTANGHDIGAWETQKAINNPATQSNLILGTAGGWWANEKKDEYINILKTSPTGSDASVQAYKDMCQLIADEVPWVGFGTGITQAFSVDNLELNYSGIYSIYWNSYFTE